MAPEPPPELTAHGWLTRPDGADLYWEETGNRDGVPVLYLHGGPGGGLGKGGYRRRFDPTIFRIVGTDQRGCGQSRPWAIDDLEHLDHNTTPTLVADLEALRDHLGIDKWLLHGVSWGCTLAVAYALTHPGRTLGVVNAAVTSTGRAEVDWITEGVGAMFPEIWSRFSAAASGGERVVEAYARLLRHPDPLVRSSAANAWDEWESTHIRLDPYWQPGPMHGDPRMRENFATLVTHYWANDGFLDPPILARVGELGGVPGVLIHGRHDVSGPAVTAWRMHNGWPGSQLQIVEDEGHGGPKMMSLVTEAAVRIARGL